MSGGKRIMARLDQIFIPNYLASNQASNGPHYYVRGDGIRSNHHSINHVLEIAKNSKDLNVPKNKYPTL